MLAFSKKPQDSEPAKFPFSQTDRGNQKTTDHEEYVDADEATAKQGEVGVEEDDGRNGNSAQAINVRAITDLTCRTFFEECIG
ncbi:hypothetical protein QW131_09110 [Roseibium salinum]|nr:hypothetical protein [Roseibium salinum]